MKTKRLFASLIFVLVSLTIFAQASGGQIRRSTSSATTVKKRKKPNLPPNSVKLDDGTIVLYETSKAVDLGLPSGTIWAGWNIGANSPIEVGSYYAWGETSTKSFFSCENYFDTMSCQEDNWGFESITFKKFHVNGVMSIIGTDYDVATVKWGEPWQMPSKQQIDELINNCKVSSTKLPNNTWIVVFSGPNGKSIAFPMSGEIYKEEVRENHYQGSLIWSGDLRPYAEASSQNSYFAYYLGSSRVFSEGFRYFGRNVRAVMKK
jgi:hypothetical protein